LKGPSRPRLKAVRGGVERNFCQENTAANWKKNHIFENRTIPGTPPIYMEPTVGKKNLPGSKKLSTGGGGKEPTKKKKGPKEASYS